MRSLYSLLLAASFLMLSACSTRNAERSEIQPTSVATQTITPTGLSAPLEDRKTAAPAEPALPVAAGSNSTQTTAFERQAINRPSLQTEKVSLTDAQSSQQVQQAFDRKIIRNAELDFETKSPADGQRRIASIAEAHGGFVVTSDASRRTGADPARPEIIVKLVVRVPSSQFGAVIDSLHGLEGIVRQEKISGQDVTEEFIDLDARIRTKKALEGQFLEIMKQAHRIQDALDVQNQLAEVRTEIERLEGRRRFLDNQSSLSTITVTLEPPESVVHSSPTGFAHDIKVAFGEGLDVATSVVVFLVRAFVSFLPIAVFLVLPALLIVRFFIRRARRGRLARELESIAQ
jgi:hypothetical protein